MTKRTEDIIWQMAKAGYERMFDDKWDELPKKSIEKALWYEVAVEMLKSVRFPGELYQLCRKLNLSNKETTKP